MSDRALMDRMNDPEMLARFYEKYSYEPVWIGQSRPGVQVLHFISELRNVESEGLMPSHYRLSEIEDSLSTILYTYWRGEKTSPGTLARFELLLTDSFFRYARDLSFGRTRLADIPERRHLEVDEEPFDLTGYLWRAIKTERIKEALREISRSNGRYALMKKNLAEYRRIESEGGWPVVGAPLKPGDKGPEVATLLVRLAASGDMEESEGSAYDSGTIAAVKRFQARHGLPSTGEMDGRTLHELDIPVSQRIETIRINMERMRWFKGEYAPRHMLVNLTDFTLKVFEESHAVIDMRVIIGKQYSSTPAFSSKLTSLVMNPAWRIPHNIALDEFVPHAIKDPSYITRAGITVYEGPWEDLKETAPENVDWASLRQWNFPYYLIMKQGPGNPLGSYKFLMPNDYNVYLHDTPGGRLFDRDVRTFSHGCVRIEDPRKLAKYLLRKTSMWDSPAIRNAMKEQREYWINLPEPIDVIIVYRTAWVDEEGRLNFRPDIYGNDESLKVALGI